MLGRLGRRCLGLQKPARRKSVVFPLAALAARIWLVPFAKAGPNLYVFYQLFAGWSASHQPVMMLDGERLHVWGSPAQCQLSYATRIAAAANVCHPPQGACTSLLLMKIDC